MQLLMLPQPHNRGYAPDPEPAPTEPVHIIHVFTLCLYPDATNQRVDHTRTRYLSNTKVTCQDHKNEFMCQGHASMQYICQYLKNRSFILPLCIHDGENRQYYSHIHVTPNKLMERFESRHTHRIPGIDRYIYKLLFAWYANSVLLTHACKQLNIPLQTWLWPIPYAAPIIDDDRVCCFGQQKLNVPA